MERSRLDLDRGLSGDMDKKPFERYVYSNYTPILPFNFQLIPIRGSWILIIDRR